MPRKTGKGSLTDKLGSRGQKAHEVHRTDPIDYGRGGTLPPGIEGGVGQLTSARVGAYKTGDNRREPYLYLGAALRLPKDLAGASTEGIQFNQTLALCDTPNSPREDRRTFEENYAFALNEVRKLGGGTDIPFEDVEAVVEALDQEKPYFRVRTYQWEFQGRTGVKTEWRGTCDYTPDESDDGVVDKTEDGPEENGDAPFEADDGDDLAVIAKAADGGDTEAIGKLTGRAKLFNIPEEDVDDAADWAAVAVMIERAVETDEVGEPPSRLAPSSLLGEQADEGNDAAIADLEAAAEEAGVDPDDYDTWAELAVALGGEKENGEQEEEDGKPIPIQDEVWYYRPPRARKRREYIITTVNTSKKTCNIKGLDDGKDTHKAVSWDDLYEEEK